MRHIAIALLVVFLPHALAAQRPDRELPDVIRQAIESVATTAEDEDIDLQALYDTYESLLENPVDLNTATEADLQALQILTDFQIRSLLDYRKEYGALFTIHELPLIHGFSEELANQLYPFITVVPIDDGQKVAFKDRFRYGRHQIIARAGRTLEGQQGYRPITPEELAVRPNARYLGSPWAVHSRYRYNHKNKTRWGFTAKNDAGEPFFGGGNKYGFDFYSAHFQLSDIGIIKQMVVGDYQVQFGQGLVAWGGYSLAKAGEVLNIKKQERGITPYTSSNENLFRRGAAITLQYKKWSLSAYASHKNIDAGADSSGFSSLQTTGQHNTASTMANKHTLPETVVGGNVSYRFKYLKIGLTALWHHYGKDYVRDSRPYNQFELADAQNANAGIDFYGVWQKISIFGEGAVSANGGLAGVVGALFDLDNAFRLSWLYRNYSRHYQAMYARGFGEAGKTNNETGMYMGLQWVPHATVTVSAYADAFSFPWLRYRTYAPSRGFEYGLQVDYRPAPTVGMHARIKQEVKAENLTNSSAAIAPTDDKNTLHARYEITYELLPGLRLKNRIELSFYRNKAPLKENGLLLFQDIKYKSPAYPFDIAVRFAVFDTDSWNTRFYAYEDDVLYTFSVPAYHAKGSRWYINTHVRPLKNIDLWLRIAQSYYFNADSVSSGLNEINKPHQTSVKIQASIKF